MDLNGWYTEWMSVYKKRRIKDGTVSTYNYIYNSLIKPELGSVEIEEIDSREIQAILNNAADRGYSDQSISLLDIVLKGVFKCAEDNELVHATPYRRIIVPNGVRKKEMVVFTRAQQRIFAEYCDYIALGDMFRFALYTGMRGGEISALTWADIDLERLTIHVRHTLKYTAGKGYWLDTPKTISSLRDVPMLPQTEEILTRLRDSGPATGLVFHTNGRFITKNRIQADIKRINRFIRADHPDFPQFTLHATRHTFATRCIEGGMKPKVLQTILGHSSLAITMDTYVKVLDDEKQNEMNAVKGLF